MEMRSPWEIRGEGDRADGKEGHVERVEPEGSEYQEGDD